jgi:hypothetical protein
VALFEHFCIDFLAQLVDLYGSEGVAGELVLGCFWFRACFGFVRIGKGVESH